MSHKHYNKRWPFGMDQWPTFTQGGAVQKVWEFRTRNAYLWLDRGYALRIGSPMEYRMHVACWPPWCDQYHVVLRRSWADFGKVRSNVAHNLLGLLRSTLRAAREPFARARQDLRMEEFSIREVLTTRREWERVAEPGLLTDQIVPVKDRIFIEENDHGMEQEIEVLLYGEQCA